MAQSPDHPELQFIPASGYTVGRPDGKPLWHVIHDMEASETPSCAENTANYFATGAGGRSVSSHYCSDDNSVVQCVLLQNVAWTVGNRPGNNRGINWELCGFASQSTAQWLDPFGAAMFNRVVPIMRSDGIRYGIPPVRRTIAELRAFIPGVTSHNDLRLAFGGTDHTDPGANFPWAYFMALLQGAAPIPRRADMAYFFSVGQSQYMADSAFERYWAFDNFSRWDAVYRAAGQPPASAVSASDLAAGVFGEYMGIYTIPRKAPECSGNGGGTVAPHSHPVTGETGDAVPTPTP